MSEPRPPFDIRVLMGLISLVVIVGILVWVLIRFVNQIVQFLLLIWVLNWTEFLMALAAIVAALWGTYRFAVVLCRLIYGPSPTRYRDAE